MGCDPEGNLGAAQLIIHALLPRAEALLMIKGRTASGQPVKKQIICPARRSTADACNTFDGLKRHGQKRGIRACGFIVSCNWG
jgi:hypothetical protein